MARVLWALSMRGTSFCGRSTEKVTGKMGATITYLIELAKWWTVILDLQWYDQNLKAVHCTNLYRCTIVDISVISPCYVYEGNEDMYSRKFCFLWLPNFDALLPIFTEAAGYSETSVTVYYHIWCGNPDDFHMINTCSKTLLTYI